MKVGDLICDNRKINRIAYNISNMSIYSPFSCSFENRKIGQILYYNNEVYVRLIGDSTICFKAKDFGFEVDDIVINDYELY